MIYDRRNRRASSTTRSTHVGVFTNQQQAVLSTAHANSDGTIPTGRRLCSCPRQQHASTATSCRTCAGRHVYTS